MDKVVWCWSQDDPNILFIFRPSGQEVQVNLATLGEKVTLHEGVLFHQEEKALLLQLRKDLEEIK